MNWEVQVQDAAGNWQVVKSGISQEEAIALRSLYLLQNKHAAIFNRDGVTNDISGYGTRDAIANAEARVAEEKARVIEKTNVFNATNGTNISIDKTATVNKPMIATIITFIVVLGIAAAYKS